MKHNVFNTEEGVTKEQVDETRLEIATEVLVGMVVNPGLWIKQAQALGIPESEPSMVALSAIALDLADTLLKVAVASSKVVHTANATADATPPVPPAENPLLS